MESIGFDVVNAKMNTKLPFSLKCCSPVKERQNSVNKISVHRGFHSLCGKQKKAFTNFKLSLKGAFLRKNISSLEIGEKAICKEIHS